MDFEVHVQSQSLPENRVTGFLVCGSWFTVHLLGTAAPACGLTGPGVGMTWWCCSEGIGGGVYVRSFMVESFCQVTYNSQVFWDPLLLASWVLSLRLVFSIWYIKNMDKYADQI